MIEGGGLGVYEPSEIGPFETQVANGVIDIAVDDDAAAVAVAKQYLSYFSGEVEGSGRVPTSSCSATSFRRTDRACTTCVP